MKRKNRIVVKAVDIEYHSPVMNRDYTISVFQEVYNSCWHKDCIDYINRQSHPEQYKIYVEEK